VKYWEIIADNLSKAGWSWGCVSAIDSEGRTIWIAAPEALKNMRWKPLRLGPRHYGEGGGEGEM